MRLATAIYIPREDAMRLIGEEPIEDEAAEKSASAARRRDRGGESHASSS